MQNDTLRCIIFIDSSKKIQILLFSLYFFSSQSRQILKGYGDALSIFHKEARILKEPIKRDSFLYQDYPEVKTG